MKESLQGEIGGMACCDPLFDVRDSLERDLGESLCGAGMHLHFANHCASMGDTGPECEVSALDLRGAAM